MLRRQFYILGDMCSWWDIWSSSLSFQQRLFWTVLHEDDSLRYVPPHDVTKRVSQIGSECINCNLIQDTSDYNWTLWHFVNIKIQADTTQAPRMVKYIWNISLQATLIIDWECREWLLLSTAALIPGWL